MRDKGNARKTIVLFSMCRLGSCGSRSAGKRDTDLGPPESDSNLKALSVVSHEVQAVRKAKAKERTKTSPTPRPRKRVKARSTCKHYQLQFGANSLAALVQRFPKRVVAQRIPAPSRITPRQLLPRSRRRSPSPNSRQFHGRSLRLAGDPTPGGRSPSRSVDSLMDGCLAVRGIE